MIKGRFYKNEYKVLKNSQNIFKIQIKDYTGWRVVLDSDLMTMQVGSHVSTDQLFFSRKEVNAFIVEQIEFNLDEVEKGYELSELKDDFKK